MKHVNSSAVGMVASASSLSSPRKRLALVTVGLAAALLADVVPAEAGRRPLVTDPKGDARVLGSGYDILSADLRTRGMTTIHAGRPVHTPTHLVLTVTFAASPARNQGSAFQVWMDTTACSGGKLRWEWAPGGPPYWSPQVTASGKGCGPRGIDGHYGQSVMAPVTVVGRTMKWVLPFRDVGWDIRPGDRFNNVLVLASVNEPVLRWYGTNLANGIDSARSVGSYELR